MNYNNNGIDSSLERNRIRKLLVIEMFGGSLMTMKKAKGGYKHEI